MRERVLTYLKQCFLNALVQNKEIIAEKAKELIPFADIEINEETPSSTALMIKFGDIVLTFHLSWVEREKGLYKLLIIS